MKTPNMPKSRANITGFFFIIVLYPRKSVYIKMREITIISNLSITDFPISYIIL